MRHLLLLVGIFLSVSSRREGVGLSPGSREAKELLGGAQRFDVVELELWTLDA